MSAEINLDEWTTILVGKKIILSGEQVVDQSKEVSEDEIKAGVPRYRIIKPGTIMTMDWREDRLNVHIDPVTKIVTKVKIG